MKSSQLLTGQFLISCCTNMQGDCKGVEVKKPAIKSKIEYLFAMDAFAVDYHFVLTRRKT